MTIQEAKEARKEKSDAKTIMGIIRASGKYSKPELDSIESKLNAGQDTGNEFRDAIDELNRTPQGQARLKDTLATQKEGRLSRRFTPFFQAAMAVSDIGNSARQIRQARNLAGRNIQPSPPPVPGIDPALNDQIRDAQLGSYDSARALGPARQVLDDQYAKDISLAKSIGGGQASTLGALGQVASMRRARGAANLVPMMDQIRAREEGRADNLIGQRGDLIDRNYRNRAYQYTWMKDQYDKDAQAIGGLGAAGRSNMRNSISNLMGATPGVAARIGTNFGDNFSGYEQSLNNSLTNNQPSFSPYSTLSATWQDRQGPSIYSHDMDTYQGNYGLGAQRYQYKPTLDY